MSCIGRHARIMETYEGKQCTVYPFNDTLASMKNIETVNAAFAFDGDEGRVFILNVNQALNFSDTMEHSLLCPNQARINGVVVDDIPPHLDYHQRTTHSIWIPERDISLPLDLHGPISYLRVRYPNEEDLDFGEYVDLTSPDDWEPSSVDFTARGEYNVSSISSALDQTIDYEFPNMPCEIADFPTVLHNRILASAMTHRTTASTTKEELASLWEISLDSAARTLKATDQDSLRIRQGKMSRRVKTRAHQRRYKQLSGYLGMMTSDTFKSNVTSLRGNKYVQLFTNRGNFTQCYSIKEKGHAHHALDRFIHDVGMPTEMLTDGARELTLGEWGKTCRRHKINQVTTEPHSPWQNPAELAGGIVKRKVRILMRKTNTPIRLFDYCWELVANYRSLTATDHIQLDGVTPFEKVHGYSPNIGEYLRYRWYQWVWYHEPTKNDQMLGRWLGPAHNIGQGFAYYILSEEGKVKTRSTVNSLSSKDDESIEVKERKTLFTKAVEEQIGNFCKATIDNMNEPIGEDPYNNLFGEDELDDEDIEPQEYDENGDIVVKPNVEEFLQDDAPFVEADDKLIGTQLPLPTKGEIKHGKVVSRKRTAEGNLVGTASANPYTDTRIYTVEFGDGTYADYAMNTLIENLYSHVDEEGRSHSTLKGIIDHTSDETAIPIDKGTFISHSGAIRKKITTMGWKLKVEWTDGTSSWIPLKDVKESNPLETAEYAEAHGLTPQPAFNWWVPMVMRKKNRIIKAVRHRLVRKNMKFGIKIPRSVDEAKKFDQEAGNNYWSKAIEKELKNVRVAFQLLNDGEKPPVGSRKITYHIIFDVKFDLTRKARLVADGHKHKDVPSHATYSSVASRDSVRLMFMLAALNGIDILSADIGNAYLNANNREKVHVVVGPELFGKEHTGQIAVIVRALYGLKSAGAAWHSHLSNYIMNELGYETTLADPDVYRKPSVKSDGTKYYSYLVVYVDDVLCFHEKPTSIMDIISDTFRLKDGVEPPKMYLGTNIRKISYQDDDGNTGKCWSMGSTDYVKEAIRVAESHMKAHNLSFTSAGRKGRSTPFSNSDYRPELDSTSLCDDNLCTVYQNLIGVLRWTCELGRLDILHEVSILSQYLAQPRIGHLQQAMNIFYYLKYHDRSWLEMDPSTFDIDWIPRGEKDVHPVERARLLANIYNDTLLQ